MLSVIVPVHNAESTIGRCLDSLLKQGVPSYEVICVENESTDGSMQILRVYESLYTDVIKVYSISEASVSSARNYGMRMASGDVLAFCDADDYLIPNAYGYLLGQYWNDKIHLLMFGSITLDKYALRTWNETNDVSGKMLFDGRSRDFVNVVRCVPTFVWNHLYRRSFIESHSMRFEALVVGEDSLFNLNMYMANVNMRSVSSNVYRYTVNDNQVTRNRNVDLMKRVSFAYVILFDRMVRCMEMYPDVKESLQMQMKCHLFSFMSRVLSSDFSKDEFEQLKKRMSEIGLLSADIRAKIFVVMRMCMYCYTVYKFAGILCRKMFVPYILPRMSRN